MIVYAILAEVLSLFYGIEIIDDCEYNLLAFGSVSNQTVEKLTSIVTHSHITKFSSFR